MSQSQRNADLDFIRQRCADTIHGGAKSALNELARDLAKQPLVDAPVNSAPVLAEIAPELDPDEPTPDGLEDEFPDDLLEH